MNLTELDRLELLVVVDNETDALSSPSPAVPRDNEPLRMMQRATDRGEVGADVFAGLCHACHGLSVLLTVAAAQPGTTAQPDRAVLFDVGPDGQLWLDNARRLGVDLAGIERVVLSHWHSDHSAGLPLVLRAITDARRAAALPPVVADLHPDRPYRRGMSTADGVMFLAPEPSWEELAGSGATIERHDQPHLVAGNSILVSGYIPRSTDYELGTPGHRSYAPDGSSTSDELMPDERYLCARIAGRGLVVLTACAHAGVVNTCRAAHESFPGNALGLVLGGFHLGGAAVEDRIPATVADLKDDVRAAVVAPGHCTGWRARAALAQAFGEQGYSPSSVGARYVLAASTG